MMQHTKSISTALITYLPVIHQGYLDFFERYPRATLVIIDRTLLTSEFRALQKDIRALPTSQIMQSLRSLLPKRELFHLQELDQLDWTQYQELILPEDEISQWLLSQLETKLPSEEPRQIKQDSIFLRWSQAKTKQKNDVTSDEQITSRELDQVLMKKVLSTAEKSGDWWRHTAAALAKDGRIIALAHNRHFPSDQLPYIFGDPRANSSRGLAIEVTTALHAEEIVIGRAAREGVAIAGADLYVTTFPCPFCARLIAYTGLKRVFYHEGYSLLDGAELLKSQGIELIKVEF